MDEERDGMGPRQDVGQGDRDIDPELAREEAQGKQPLGEGHSAMPDFTSGPGYTGQIPLEGASASEGELNAGGDTGE